MSADTIIQWCNATVNFWWGCTKVSTGCQFCYAESMALRLSKGRATWGPDGARWLRVDEAVRELLALNARAEKRKTRLRVFINSMSDTFEDRRDLDTARHVIWAVARVVRSLDLLLLTKRPENVARLVAPDWLAGSWPANVWLGTTTENQEQAEIRIPYLLNLPAPVRFLSCEPLLGPVNLRTASRNMALAICDPATVQRHDIRKIEWVIAGGESGQRARPCDLDWFRSLRDQCFAARVPFFLKQLGRRPVDVVRLCANGPREIVCLKLQDSHGGDMTEWPADLRVRQFPMWKPGSEPEPTVQSASAFSPFPAFHIKNQELRPNR